MSAATELTDGLLELESELGQTFTWHNVSYPCIAGGDMRSSDYDSALGGIVRRDSSSIVVRAGLFSANAPVVRDMIVFNSRTFRIDDIRRAPNVSFYVYSLADPTE